MKYKIVFVDVDDTLIYNHNPMGEKTKDIMKKLKEKNILVVINSGRDNRSAVEKSIEGNLSNFVISSNGTEIYDREKKEIIMQRSLPAKTIKEIYEYASLHDMGIYLNCIQKRYTNKKEEQIIIEDIEKVIKENTINQIVITSTNYDRMLSIPNLFKEKFPDTQIVHSSIPLIEKRREKNKIYYHDIVVAQTTKATGIAELLDYLHMTKEEAIAIGNGYDDICMKEVVDKLIAVENANENLKNIADAIVPSVQEEGVATFLNQLL